ncbi:MAG TPA: DUF2844 domain-containing protein [Terriglobales bacterium]|nr:DUF2844 domain-containing protein [Terriglobales bacterium]
MKMTLAFMCAALAIAIPLRAPAALGGDLGSVEADTAQFHGTVRILKMTTHTVLEIRTATGVTVREYVSPSGHVFGVAWQGRANPDLQQVLGPYYEQMMEAARSAGPVRGRPFIIEEPNLVVQMSGTMRAHFGRAFDPKLMPAQVQPADIR